MVQSGGNHLLTRGDIMDLRRVHVTDPVKWATQVGTDFWIINAANGALTASGQNLITDGGWTATSLAAAAGSGADFMSKADPGTPGQLTTDAGADLIQSPAIFGDYAHAHAAATIMGQKSLPRFLVADIYARWSVLSADEVTTNLGFVEDGGSIVVAADAMATIYSKGTGLTWNMQANATVVTGVVDNSTSPTWFRIALDKNSNQAFYYVDGVYNGVTTITADEFPASFGAGIGTTNRVQLNQAHIFYAWTLPYDPAGF